MMRLVLLLAALLGLTFPGVARAQCPAGSVPGSWPCLTPLSGNAQSTDLVLAFRPGGAQGPLSISQILASVPSALTVTDGTNTVVSVAQLTFVNCTVSGTSPDATATCNGGSSITWPTSGDIVVSNGTSSPAGLAASSGYCAGSTGSGWTLVSCGGAIEVADQNGDSVSSVATLTYGPGFLVSGSNGAALTVLNQPDRAVTACSGTPNACLVLASDMGGQVNYDGSSLTATIPAIATASFTGALASGALTVSSVTGTVEIGQLLIGAGVPAGTIIISGSGSSWQTNGTATVASEAMTSSILASGQTVTICNYSASSALTISSTPVINGYSPTTLPAETTSGVAACLSFTSNGATLDGVPQGTLVNLAFLNQNNTWSGTQTWGASVGAPNVQSGASYSLAATDCGNTIIFTASSAITLTATGTLPVGCAVAIEQKGSGQVTVVSDGSSSITSASSYTKTRTQYSVIGLYVDSNTGGTNANFNLTGDGA